MSVDVAGRAVSPVTGVLEQVPLHGVDHFDHWIGGKIHGKIYKETMFAMKTEGFDGGPVNFPANPMR